MRKADKCHNKTKHQEEEETPPNRNQFVTMRLKGSKSDGLGIYYDGIAIINYLKVMAVSFL